jgi:acid phosphatase type 7
MDVSLSQSSPTTNFGKAPQLQVGGLPGSEQVTLIRWDLTKITINKKVLSTSFGINVTAANGQTYLLYQALRNWDQNLATWNGASKGVNWQVPGAKGANDRGSVILGTLEPAEDGTYEITLNSDGIKLVQSWIRKSTPNYGFILAASPGANNLEFASDENATPRNRPQLKVQISTR